jgi:hypothetical protein
MGRKLLCVAGVMVATLILSGCATMRVGSHTDRALVWSKYRTFDWGPADGLPARDTRLDKDPVFQDRVAGAIEKAMAAHGLELSAASERPDLLIHYHASRTERIDVDRVDRGFGYCTTADCRPRVTRYEASTLVVDIVDARSNVLVWRGWAQDSVGGMMGNRDRQRRQIDEGVGRMFATLPGSR